MKRRNPSRATSASTRKRARALLANAASAANLESRVVQPRSTEALAELRDDEMDLNLAWSQHSHRMASATWGVVSQVLRRAAQRFDSHDIPATSKDYLTVYSHVNHIFQLENERGEPVKRAFYALVHNFVRDYIDNQLAHLNGLSGKDLLEQYCHRWHTSAKYVQYLQRALHHMHKYWIPNTSKPNIIMGVDRLRLVFWKELMRTHVPNLTDQIIALIDDERTANPQRERVEVTRAIRETLSTFKKIGDLDVAPDQETSIPGHGLDALKFYETAFEKSFVRATGMFYTNVAGECHANIHDPAQLVSRISQMFDDENARLARLVEERTHAPTRRILETKLIADHVDMYHAYAHKLVSSPQPLDKVNKQSLRTVVRLLCRIPAGLGPVRNVFRKCVVQEGRGILQMHLPTADVNSIKNFSKYLPLVSHMLQLHNRRLRMVHESFEKRNEFSMALDAGFRDVLNSHTAAAAASASMAVILAHYAHHVLSGEILDDVPLIPKIVPDNEERIRVETILSSGTAPSKRARTRYTPPSLPSPRTYSQRVQMEDDNRDPRVRGLRRSARLRKKSSSDSTEKVTVEDDENPDANVNVEDVDITTQPTAFRDCSLSQRKRDEVLDTHLDRVARLFVFIDDKEGFFETARQLMSKRLLGRYAERLESKFILKLNEYTGPQFTSKLDGMLADMQKCRNTSSAFTVAVNKGEFSTAPMRYISLLRDSRVNPLNSICWPKFKQDQWRIPRPLRVLEETFDKWYCSKGSERSVTWIRSLSSVTVGAKVSGRTFNIEATVLQASVLMQLNAGKTVTIKQAADHANAEQEDIRVHLASLTCNGLLTIRGDTILVNDEFTTNKHTVVTKDISHLVGQPARSTPRKSAFVERNGQIDAAIVRTMKKNKRMLFSKLAQQIIQMRPLASAQPTLLEIETRTNHLVDNEYLARDNNTILYKV